MAKKIEVPSIGDIKALTIDALRKTSVRPSLAGYKPQAHQIAFHSSTKKGRLFLGGNRSGKTVGGAAEAVMWLTGKHRYFQKFAPPVRGRAIGVDFDDGIKKIILPEIARWVPPSFLINGSWEDSYSKGDRVLTLNNGSFLEFMSYDQDIQKFAGTSRHFTWFDEEPPEDIFTENLLRLLDVGGHWWMTMTPLIDMSWTYDRLYLKGKAGDPNLDVFEVMTSQNIYVNASEIEIVLDGIDDEEEKQARLEGVYMGRSNTIYGDHINPKINYVPSILESDNWPLLHSGWGHFGMLDHGYTNPTAFYLAAYDNEGRIVVYDEYYKTKRLVHENAAAISNRIRELKLEEKLDYIVADPSVRNTDPITGTSVLQEYGDNGIYLTLGNNDVDAGILRVGGKFKRRELFITKNCERLIWELGKYRWDKFTSKKVAVRHNQKEVPIKKDDHGCDALRYGVMSRPQLNTELDIPTGNVLNTAVARDDWGRDFELLEKMTSNTYGQSGQYDPHLGVDY